MAEINVDYEDFETANAAWSMPVSDHMHLNTREDAETITKVQSLGIPDFPQMVETSLHGRVNNAQDQAHDWVLDQLENFDTTGVALTPPNSNDVEANYMFQIRALIAQILVQLNRISQKDRDQIDKLKVEYKRLTQETAGYQRQLGNNNLMFSLVALGAALFQMAENPVDRECAKIFAENVCPKLGEMFGSDIQANTTRTMNLSNLYLQEYQGKTSKGQADSSNKQEIIQMLDRALSGLTQAARSS